MGWKAIVGVLALALVAVAGFAFMPAKTASAAPQQQCTGDEKIEGSSAQFTAPEGKSISRICIKAGTELYSFECGNTGDGCYHIEWIYDDCYYAIAANVTGGGTSRTCKEISNVVATYVDCGQQP
jgi:hypothetical protein